MSHSVKNFSPAQYMAKQRKVEKSDLVDFNSQFSKFHQLCQDMRNYLSAPKGMNDEERTRYSETLNHAVLGFPNERKQILAIIEDRLLKLQIFEEFSAAHPYATLAEAIFAEVVGLHVLELILKESNELEEIQVVGTQIFTVNRGKVKASSYAFEDLKEVERIQQNLVLYNNDQINPRKRWAEVMLKDGSRVTMTGFGYTAKPTLTIRFYTLRHLSLKLLSEPPYRLMNKEMYKLLQKALEHRYNLVFIGATNTGKTNLMKALIAELPPSERIVTIEGRFEMMLSRDYPHHNIVEYEISEDDRLHNAQQAFKLALRQSPKRIIHAEIRDEDANIYVRACTRGHHGSMTTVHANSLEDVPDAITDMCMQDGRHMEAIRLTRRITQYVTQIGIQLDFQRGRRVITRIGRMLWNNHGVEVDNLVEYQVSSDDWRMNHANIKKYFSDWEDMEEDMEAKQ